MYFIFTSFWAYKIYYVYGFMLLGEHVEGAAWILDTSSLVVDAWLLFILDLTQCS